MWWKKNKRREWRVSFRPRPFNFYSNKILMNFLNFRVLGLDWKRTWKFITEFIFISNNLSNNKTINNWLQIRVRFANFIRSNRSYKVANRKMGISYRIDWKLNKLMPVNEDILRFGKSISTEVECIERLKIDWKIAFFWHIFDKKGGQKNGKLR